MILGHRLSNPVRLTRHNLDFFIYLTRPRKRRFLYRMNLSLLFPPYFTEVGLDHVDIVFAGDILVAPDRVDLVIDGKFQFLVESGHHCTK